MNLLSLLSPEKLGALFSSENIASVLPRISVLCVIAAAKLGVVMPLVVSAISQSKFSARTRTVLSIMCCLAASAVVCLATGVFTGLNWAAAMLIMLSTTWGLYEHFYKPSGIAPWFERITSVAKFVPLVLALFGIKATAALETAQGKVDAVTTATDAQSTSADQ